MNNDIHNYDDIRELPHPVSKNHAPMPRRNRAAQFAPFAALSGYTEILKETQRLVDDRKLLDEHQKAILDEALQEIMVHIQEQPLVKLTYYQPDEKKEGGSYVCITNTMKRIDEVYQILHFVDKKSIAIADIYEIERIA